MLQLPPDPRCFGPEHEAFRASLRAFVEREIAPFVTEWDEAGTFPRELYTKAAAIGLLGLGYPEEHGGTPADPFMHIVAAEEIARAGSGGLQAALGSHGIALPPIVAHGSAALQALVLPGVIAGREIAALAITEPGGGSDVAAISTTARRDGAHYVVDGEKTFITSGVRADWLTVAVRTDPARKGPGGISLLVVRGDTPGLERTNLKKTGWWASDTAHIRFDGCRVPAEQLVGAEGEGFKAIMHNFNHERLMMAAMAVAYAEVCTGEALDWARQRHTFGAALVERQVIRHKLVDMQRRVDAARALVYELAYRLQHRLGDANALVARACMAKIEATQAMQFCADAAVQILGGMGYMRGTKSERLYREVKVMMIGGGSEEIMKDLAARQLGLQAWLPGPQPRRHPHSSRTPGTMTITVHHIPVCPFSQRLEILLQLKGCRDAVEFRVVDITRPREAALLALTGGRTALPVLVADDGTVLRESLVILDYLDALLPGPRIAAADPLRRAVEALMVTMEGPFGAAGYRLVMNQDPTRRDALLADLLAQYAALDEHLARFAIGQPWLQQAFGWAEVVFTPLMVRFAFLDWYEGFVLPDEPRYDRVRAWREACLAHPAARQVSAEEVVKLYADYAQGAGNGALLPGRQRSSFVFTPHWRERPWPPRDKHAGVPSDEALGLV